MAYPALLLLMRTPRLPVVDWTDASRQYKWTRPFRRKTNSGFCACAITFQLASTTLSPKTGNLHPPPPSKKFSQQMCFILCNGTQTDTRQLNFPHRISWKFMPTRATRGQTLMRAASQHSSSADTKTTKNARSRCQSTRCYFTSHCESKKKCWTGISPTIITKRYSPTSVLTLNPLTWKIWWAPNNASRWEVGFNSACKGLMYKHGWSRKFTILTFCHSKRMLSIKNLFPLTPILLTSRIGWAPNANKRQMGFNLGFKGLIPPTACAPVPLITVTLSSCNWLPKGYCDSSSTETKDVQCPAYTT